MEVANILVQGSGTKRAGYQESAGQTSYLVPRDLRSSAARIWKAEFRRSLSSLQGRDSVFPDSFGQATLF